MHVAATTVAYTFLSRPFPLFFSRNNKYISGTHSLILKGSNILLLSCSSVCLFNQSLLNTFSNLYVYIPVRSSCIAFYLIFLFYLDVKMYEIVTIVAQLIIITQLSMILTNCHTRNKERKIGYIHIYHAHGSHRSVLSIIYFPHIFIFLISL